MKNYTILIIMILFFDACNKSATKEEPVLELISYRWQLNDEYFNNQYKEWEASEVAIIRAEIYAQIYKNGDCLVSKYRGENQNELYANFKIDTTVLNPVLQIFSSLSKDTLMISMAEPGKYIYDGPMIRVIGKNKNGLIQTIKFDNSSFSNAELRELFSHLEQKSDSVRSNNIFIQTKEKRIQEIYNQEINSISIPIIKPDEEL